MESRVEVRVGGAGRGLVTWKVRKGRQVRDHDSVRMARGGRSRMLKSSARSLAGFVIAC